MTLNTRIVARLGLLHTQVDRLRSAHHLAEDALTRHDAGVDEWYEKELERLESTDPDDAEFLAFLHSEQKAEAADAYPFVLRSALFGTAYGMFEFCMTSLCKQIEKQVEGPRLNELRGEGIRRANLYLLRVARVAVPDSDEWRRLLKYGLLRNAIVHAQGDLAGNDHAPAIRELQATERTFALTSDASAVTLSGKFLPKFLDTVDAYAMQLHVALAPIVDALY